jgi:hypothetical protein
MKMHFLPVRLPDVHLHAASAILSESGVRVVWLWVPVLKNNPVKENKTILFDPEDSLPFLEKSF